MPSPTAPARAARVETPRPPLVRDRDCVVAGVSSGIARHLGARVWVVRALFAALSLCGGAGVLLYAWCWVFTPWQEGEDAPTRRAPVAWTLLAGGGIGLLVIVVWSLGGFWHGDTLAPRTAALVVGNW